MSEHARRSVGSAVLALVMGVGLAACGDDDGTGPRQPDLTRAEVAGQYEMTALSFDPPGSLGPADILERLEQQDVPTRLVVSATKDSLQLIFEDPVDGLIRPVPGGYRLGDTGISATFSSAAEPAKLLLPRTLSLTYSEEPGTLSFTGSVTAQTERLFELVPEWSEEPWTSTVNGQLQVVFTRTTP